MTIEIIKGDLLEGFARGEVDIIGHVVNCQSKMNSGIAKTIREKYPQVYDRYMMMSSRSSPEGLLGYAQFIYTDMEPDKGVYNLFAQLHYGYDGKKYLNYGALGSCLNEVKDFLHNNGLLSVGFPYNMGSDRAGGDWDIVLEMIDFYFKNRNVKIYKLSQ